MEKRIYTINGVLVLFFCFLLFVFAGGITAEASSVSGGSPVSKEAPAPKDIRTCTVTLSKTTFSYNGQKCGPKVTVKDGTALLAEGVDYTLYGATASTIGKHEITILGMGNYTGQATAVFQIQKAKNAITIDTKTFYTYSNPASYNIYCDTIGNAKLTYSTKTKGASISKDGILSLKDGFLGTVKVTVKAAESEFYQAATKTFSIKVKLKGTRITEIKNEGAIPDILPENDHTVKVFWDAGDMEIQSVGGFQLRYSTDKTFKKKVYKSKIPMLNAFGSLVNACSTSKNLVKGKKTYFQVRTYKKALDGKTYYSAWSNTVSHKVDSSEKAFYRGKAPKNGEVFTNGGIEYKYKDKKLEAVNMKYSTLEHQILIPDTVRIYGKKYPVTSVKSSAFRRARAGSMVLKITIGKNVKSIGKNAFADNWFVQDIIIKSKNLTSKSVGKNAFKDTGFRNPSVNLKAPASKKSAYKKLLQKAGMKNVK